MIPFGLLTTPDSAIDDRATARFISTFVRLLVALAIPRNLLYYINKLFRSRRQRAVVGHIVPPICTSAKHVCAVLGKQRRAP